MNEQVSIYIIEMDFGEKHVKQPRRSDKFLKVADNTGNTVWPSARPFFLYLTETNRDLLFKRSSLKTNTLPRILELGSGTGVLGFALASLGCEVVLTDPGLDMNLTDEDSLAHVQVNTLDVLKESAEVNRKLFATPSELNRKVIPFHAAVRKLAWGSDQDIQAIQREFGVSEIGSESQRNLESGFDVIVGSDILYDPHKFPYLLKTLKDLAGDDTDILLCGPVRKVESQFLKMAERDFEISQPLRPGFKLPHSDHSSFVFCLRKV